ncbi:histidinol-phosphate aminotransferase [Thalassobaculum fulvum]|uniref:Histidinol-phosphate aminotransferase n=1 Tax=Thalassobaculum fulvum TaxID=1633335 RepID=A0A918XX09_9PROT|nr:histidinol-phosphate transaminase [Thalassobaculum fulvum]GHD62719.1 histidinol-phosphate aminotransferase [Thalassobaculum fulvum]
MADANPSPTFPKGPFRSMPAPGWPPTQRDSTSGIDPAQIHRMNLNESPFPPSPKAIAAMQEAAAKVNYYPDPKWRDLTAALSAHTGVPQGRIVMAHGSDELIVQIGRLALYEGDEVLVPTPSFPGYSKCAAVNGAKLVAVKVRQDGAPDIDGMLEAVTDRTRLVFLCTPNNPTGGMLTTEEVVRFARGLPNTTVLVIDEAYYEYGRHAGGSDHLAALSAADVAVPWVSFRTFSKAYGLAGLRVGYALCGSDAMAETLQKIRSVFNVSRVAQAGALAALADQEHTRSILERTRIERERIMAGIVKLGCEPFPSVGNFISARTPKPPAEVCAGLEARGVMISSLHAPGFDDYVRITTGNADDTDALLAALEEVLK